MNSNNSRTGLDDLRFAIHDLRDPELTEAIVNPKSQIVNPADGSVMRLIPAGEFIMGSTPEQIEVARHMDIRGHEFTLLDELPQFRALLPDFYLCEHAVTNEQFARFLNATTPPAEQLKLWAPALERIQVLGRAGSPPPAANSDERRAQSDAPYLVARGFERHPVVHVSWFGADAYCRWAGLRLPTELEWEKVARGTDGRLYPWGNEWHDDFLRWHNTAKHGLTTAPVNDYPQGCSPFGILQMAGNVDEWCAESYQWDVYRRYATGDLRPPFDSGTGVPPVRFKSGTHRQDACATTDAATRVVRGGTCVGWQKIRFRCAHRRGNDAAVVNIRYTGIRCACEAAAGETPTVHE
jgi:formylglycine-generating enzyme required for sulfatase activity